MAGEGGAALIRGVIEGFYGPPWTHEERLDLIRFCANEGLDTWVHAPKDDPFHRERWREPYPETELTQLGATSLLLTGPADASTLAVVSHWCEENDVLPESLALGQRTLEDVFLELTGKALR